MRRQEARIEDNDDLKIKRTSPNIPALKSAVGSNAFNLVEQMQYLYVRIIRARDLFDSNKNSSTSFESYPEVRVGNYKGMSSSKKTPNPEWNQVFAFSKDRIHSSYMEIILRTDNKNNNSSCEETCSFKGGLVYDMNDVPTRVPPDSPLAPQWCKLRGESVRGDLMLAVWMGTQADEAFPEAWHSDCIGVSVEGVMNTRSKVYLSPRLWYLRVNVIQVQDLNLNLQEKNKREVFIRAIVGNTVLKSSRSWNLSWNEDLLFVVAEPFEHMLVLSVEDKNGGTVLGKCNIHLHSLERRVVNKPVAARWYCLENPGKVVNGKIHLRISLDGGYHVLDESTHFSSDLRPTVKQLWKSCIGVLELGILNARGLPAMKKTTDAYCVAKYGQKWVRTRTIIDCTTPQWNEQYTWEVFDPCTVITVAVFDNSNLNGNGTQTDARIGKIKIRLSTLETNRIYTNSYPLIVLHPQGVKRMGEIQLAVRFTCSSFFTLLQTYCEPILPAMHYLHPLSVYQLHYLRYQASHILAIRLSRSEPSLRKEVVEYMLDMGSTSASASASASGWSSRICKANYQRCRDQIALLLHFFNSICSWEKPVVTTLLHFVVFIFILYPRFILPTTFFHLFIIGVWNYQRRDSDPPYLDVRLSFADKVGFEELDEEFDTFPTSRTVNVITVRYDRLRGVAGRVQAVIGDFATQLERFNSLLTWRDPTATAFFLAFCLLASLLLYATPFKLVATTFTFYLLRHPNFRQRIPPAPLNFFRRLPARSDCFL